MPSPINPLSITQEQIDAYVPDRFAGSTFDSLPNALRQRVLRRLEREQRVPQEQPPVEPVEPVDG